MSVDYKGLLKGDIAITDLAKAIFEVYGGERFEMRFGLDTSAMGPGAISSGHYVLEFIQEMSPEVRAMRHWERKPHLLHRTMHVFNEGACAGDYADLTTEPMTYVSLGHWGECREIIDGLVARFGGYVMDEAGSQEWESLPADRVVEMTTVADDRFADLTANAVARDARIEAEMERRKG